MSADTAMIYLERYQQIGNAVSVIGRVVHAAAAAARAGSISGGSRCSNSADGRLC
jgi:hypothetical protein